MLRDGQFLQEKPIAIGGGWAPTCVRDDYTTDEIIMQRALLNARPNFRIPMSVGGWMCAVVAVSQILIWLAR